MPRDGRPSIFTGPGEKVRYQGIVTKEGARRIEHARLRLANLSGFELERVSDGAVFEYLARGDADTRRYLKGRR